MNKYKVFYKGLGSGVKFSVDVLRCRFRDEVNVFMVEVIDFFFNIFEWEGYLFMEDIRIKVGLWGKCVVVLLAGFLKFF